MYGAFEDHVNQTLDEIRAGGFWKGERIIATPQGAEVGVVIGPGAVLVFAAGNGRSVA